MNTMQAVRLHGIGDLRVETVEIPRNPRPDEIIVAVEAAGICGSDLHNFRTGMWMSRTPSIPGHEFVGRIVAAGSAVATLVEGERVIADSRVTCGTCDMCSGGRSNLCRSIGYVGEVIDGGFAPFVRLRERQVLRLVDQALSPTVAAMAEPLAVALHAVNRLAPRHGEPIAITGAGPIGAMAALLLKHQGFGPLLIADRNSDRRATVTRLTGAEPVEVTGIQAPLLCETTGSASVLAAVLAQMPAGGRIASVGIFHERGDLDLNRIVEGEIELVGCAAFSDELHIANELLTPLSSQLSQLASEPIALSEVPAAYAQLVQGQAPHIKTIIVPA